MPPNTSAPHTYPRRILLAVAANSPQIVTETLFALARHTVPAWLPTELHIITTLRGAKHVREGLCPNTANQLGRLCADYAIPMPLFDTSHIHLITDAAGQALEDVRSNTDNTHAADFISRVVRQFTADEQASLHVSLSGGRRTMTYYIGYALSLFGRSQDRLSHVVVDSEYFFNHEFYYPPPRATWVVRMDGTGFDAAKVEVTLSDIPFVRLRDGLPQALLAGDASFSSTIAAAQRRFAPPAVVLDWQRNTLTCGGITVSMSPVNFAFYAWMLQRRVQNLPPVHWTNTESTPLETQFLGVYYRLFGDTGGYAIVKRTLNGGMNKPWFDERKSHTNKILKQTLGDAAAHDYLLHRHGTRPKTRVGISLPTHAISLQ